MSIRIVNFMTRFAVVGTVSVAFTLAGCTLLEPAKPTVFPESVPDIEVSIDCGECEVRPAVPESLRNGYIAAAEKAGVKIDPNMHANIMIKAYKERSVAMRSATLIVSIILPPVAMVLKDEIKADVVINGKVAQVEYNYRIPFLGVESVARKVGELSFYEAVKHINNPKSADQKDSLNQGFYVNPAVNLASILSQSNQTRPMAVGS
ncbi:MULTISPECIES: hypothetical protein [Burkholderia]|uniref:Lipoprotein n=1 Tax=Burkholderia paludis TaxID=1506587 RepID=A0A6J5F1G6_9BURK|nr:MULTISPECIES: hypothetical protein [Burkholderia]CAB3771557.1 hypothetical protein LMG30113_06496 [Burkholderia paludis]VWC28327.1 hypothetical protein BPA30113_06136 [Burkholderia paludis]